MKNIEKIQIDYTYTYKELCKLLEEKEKTSNSKTAQLKEWQRYFRLDRPTNRQYIIREIYSKPMEKEDGRRNNGGNSTSKYLGLDDIIMEHMEQVQNTSGTVSQLLKEIGIVSQKYIDNRQIHVAYQKGTWSQSIINNVFWKMDLVNNAMKSALERLKRSGNLEVTRHGVLVLVTEDTRILNEKETEELEIIRQKVLLELNLEINDLYNKKNREKFINILHKELSTKFDCSVKYSYIKYEIINLNKDYKRKTKLNAEDLTRKFVKEICYKLLQIDYKGIYHKAPNMKQIILLMEDIFPHMTFNNWKKYFKELEGSQEEEKYTKFLQKVFQMAFDQLYPNV